MMPTNKIISMFGLVILAVSCLLVASCTLPRPLPPVRVYSIFPKKSDLPHRSVTGSRCGDTVVKMARMSAGHWLNTTDILYADRNYGLNSYAFSRWSSTPASMLESLLASTLEDAGAYRVVLPSGSRADYDLLLESRLNDCSLHLQDGNRAEGVVSVECFLIDAARGRLLASRKFVIKTPSEGTSAAQAVGALNSSANMAAYEVAVWLSGRCQEMDE